ncbi:PAS/PAC sensor signal transduction histidine kinase [Methanosalsum zhilinae DSM 4017]|uniref:PAS/PAC sensor signal transduction histidine kinase n=1 Tax=Methanosalsum zhilinae (strain DSM 4017 / NBRC 107636 / OCM 62 / WeN5) TaxID=679901 RepID=F7XM32_METZD|nr:PAS domain-containing protein [Methanosalsum zhilinae]AEH61290.1 PAS/PAC sensor signal transduction histidine kinase [Methanosalsum zhilinae DSM 4017]
MRMGEDKYRSIFVNALDGIAIHRIILDEHDRPVDFVFLEANNSFEKLACIKLSEIIGKRATQIFPGIEDTPLIETLGKVVIDGEPVSFENYFIPS